MRQLLPAAIADVDLLEVYAPPADRTHVRVNFVSSADGAATLVGLSEGLSGPADKRVFGVLRTLADVVLVGAGTVRAEGYGAAKVSAERQAWRTARGYAAIPPMAVVTGRAALDHGSRFFTEAVARPLVYTLKSADADALEAVADVVRFDGDSVPVASVVADLAGRGLRRILCEGGPSLFGDLVAADVMDELDLTLSPLIAGPKHPRIIDGAPLPGATRLTLEHVLTEDGFLFLRYTR